MITTHEDSIMNDCVYILRIIGSVKVYVGSTGDLTKRLDRHLNELDKGIHHNVNLQELYNRNITLDCEVVRCTNRELAYNLEQSLITKFRKQGILLNIGDGVKGGDNLTHNPNREDIISRTTATTNSNIASMSPDDRKSTYGRPGDSNGMFNKHHTEESKELMKSIAMGKVHSQESKDLMKSNFTIDRRKSLSLAASKRIGNKNSFYGKTHTDSTRKAISLFRKGKVNIKTRKKVSIHGTIYNSMTEAATALNVNPSNITYMVNSNTENNKDCFRVP